MVKYYCDRCKVQQPEEDSLFPVIVNTRNSKAEVVFKTRYDICIPCRNAVVVFIEDWQV